MKKAQQVVDDYHKAVDIYAGYHRPYLFAAKIFFNYSQYEDAKNVIEYARENQVELLPYIFPFPDRYAPGQSGTASCPGFA